jgi:hypothetical protein
MRKIIVISIIILSCLPLFAQENEKKWGFGLGYEYTLPSKIEAENILSSKHSGLHKVSLLVDYKLGERFSLVSGYGMSIEKINIEINSYDSNVYPDTASFNITQFVYMCIPVYIEYTLYKKSTNNINVFGGINLLCNKAGKSNYYPLYPSYTGVLLTPESEYVLGLNYKKKINKVNFKFLLQYKYCPSEYSFRIQDRNGYILNKKPKSQFAIGLNIWI